MKTDSKKKFSDLFKEDTGGEPAPSNVSSDSATSGLSSNMKPAKRKELEKGKP